MSSTSSARGPSWFAVIAILLLATPRSFRAAEMFELVRPETDMKKTSLPAAAEGIVKIAYGSKARYFPPLR